MSTIHPPLEQHLDNIIAEGLTVFAGAPKIGKSWFLEDLGLAVATGGTILGVRVPRRPVLQLALEDSERRLQARARTLGYGLDSDTPDRLDHWWAVTRLAGERVTDLIARWHEQLPHGDDDPTNAPLIMLDTWGRAKGPRPPSMSPYDHDYAVGVALKDAADMIPGSSFVVAHHDRKADAADFVDSLSGTHGIGGSADTVIVVRRDRIQPHGVLLVTGRDIREASYGVTFLDGRWSLIGGTWAAAEAAAVQIVATVNRGPIAQKAVAYLGEHGASELAAISAGIGADPDTVRMALSRMCDEGHVVRLQRGVYSLPIPQPSLFDDLTDNTREEHP